MRSGLGDRRLSGNESWGLRLGSSRRGGSQLRDAGMRERAGADGGEGPRIPATDWHPAALGGGSGAYSRPG